METLLTLPFFTGLPGSARVQLVDTLMTTLAHECVWAPLAPAGNSHPHPAISHLHAWSLCFALTQQVAGAHRIAHAILHSQAQITST